MHLRIYGYRLCINMRVRDEYTDLKDGGGAGGWRRRDDVPRHLQSLQAPLPRSLHRQQHPLHGYK